jgi:flagellin
MYTLRTNSAAALSYNALKSHNLNSAQHVKQLVTGERLSSNPLNQSSYIKAGVATSALRSAEVAMLNINTATSLVQSIDSSAKLIQDKLMGMRDLAMTAQATLGDGFVGGVVGDKGQICLAMRQAQDSITDTVNRFNWNGMNFMLGGGQNNHTTTARAFNINVGGSGVADNIQMSFKSFHPMSAVDTNGSFFGNAAAPNLPNLNKSAGTDTHAYGDAAMYSGISVGRYLHVDNFGAVSHTLVQLDRAIDGVSTERMRLAGYLERLSSVADLKQSEIINAQKTKSLIVDADYARQVAGFSKTQILKQTATAMLAQVNRRGSAILELLE